MSASVVVGTRRRRQHVAVLAVTVVSLIEERSVR
jgi:hypothetical protein